HWKWCCWEADARGYVRLCWKFLTRVVPRELWRDLIGALCGHAPPGSDRCYPTVIESDLTAAQGEKCTGYRLAEGYRKVRRVVCTAEALNRKIRRVYGAQDRNLSPLHRWLRDKFDLLDYDFERARSIIAGLR